MHLQKLVRYGAAAGLLSVGPHIAHDVFVLPSKQQEHAAFGIHSSHDAVGIHSSHDVFVPPHERHEHASD